MTQPKLPAFVAGATFALPASADSGLALNYASTTPAVWTVAGTTVTQLAAGTCNITASNAGHANFLPLSRVLSFALVAAVVPGTVSSIPTLSEWGMTLLALAMAGMVWLARRRSLESSRGHD